jgi:hypothetical protein
MRGLNPKKNILQGVIQFFFTEAKTKHAYFAGSKDIFTLIFICDMLVQFIY